MKDVSKNLDRLLQVKVPAGAILYVTVLLDNDMRTSIYPLNALLASDENKDKARAVAALHNGLIVL